jgi:hypothetical protein
MIFRPVLIHLRPAWCVVVSLLFAVFTPHLVGQDDERLWLTTAEDPPSSAVVKPQAETNNDQQQAETLKKKRAEKKEALAKAVAGAHKDLFYENDFQYLLDPDYQDWYLGDTLKRNPLGTQ